MGIWENGIYKEVHPCFLYEVVVTFTIFLVTSFLQKRRKFKGEITYLYFIIYSFARFLIESLRADSLMLGNARISQVLSVIIFVVFLAIMLKKVENLCKKPQSSIK